MNQAMSDLLLNVLFLMLPLFLYQILWLERVRPASITWRTIGLIGAGTGLLCMLFPIQTAPGFFYDLRLVPVILCYLYGGVRSGLLASGILLAYRIYLGGQGAYGSLVITLLLAAAGLLLFRSQRFLTHNRRTIYAGTVSILSSGAVLLVSVMLNKSFYGTYQFGIFAVQYVSLSGGTMLLMVYMIETIRSNYIMREMLEQAKKTKVVSELAASVSHEVRNPLTVTRGFIQLLKQDNLAPEKRTVFIDYALEELGRAESIINDFLSYAKPQLQSIEFVDVNHEVKYVSDVIAPFATMQQVRIELCLTGTSGIRGERDKFRQCLMNLAKNAVEAMPQGGTLSFQIQRVKQVIEIKIKDTGIGMTKEQLSRLGSPYYSTKEKGTGLGTMVVYSMIRAMGGRIEVETKLGEGTTFHISLPAA